jgi:hypothetical protein
MNTTPSPTSWRNRKRSGERRNLGHDATQLGVHRSTLYRLLSGRTNNSVLRSRYLDLVRLRSPQSKQSTIQ